MGYRNGAISGGEENGVSASVNEALLFTTMCIIGHPVDVHVKDGSIYSGTLYTANVDSAYAVVLQKARRIKEGNRETNVAEGKLIDTLVILSEDLVQVIAKEISLPSDGICGKAGADFLGLGAGFVNPCECEEMLRNSSNHTEAGLDQKGTSPTRQGCGGSEVKQGGLLAEPAEQAECSRLSLNAHGSHPAAKEIAARTNKVETSSVSYVSSQIPRLDDPHARHTLEASRQSLSEKGNHGHATIVKESKLNPKAKLFSPSPAQHRSATPMPLGPTPPIMNHTSVVAAEPEVDISFFTNRSSVPAKSAMHNKLFSGNGRNDIPYGQHFVGHAGSKMPPIRYAGQYSHLQAGPHYVHPSPQTVMAGRMGPLVYVHPVSNDALQGAAGFSQVSSRPLMAPQQINMPKHQGTPPMQALQLYMTPPFIANGHQTFAVPTYIPIPPPIFPVAGPIPVPGSDVSFSTKFA